QCPRRRGPGGPLDAGAHDAALRGPGADLHARRADLRATLATDSGIALGLHRALALRGGVPARAQGWGAGGQGDRAGTVHPRPRHRGGGLKPTRPERRTRRTTWTTTEGRWPG